MSECNHVFEKYDPRLVEEIRNAGVGSRRGVPTQLLANLDCKKCGESVAVEYNLSFIGGEQA